VPILAAPDERNGLRTASGRTARRDDPYTLEIEVTSLSAGEPVNLGAGLNHARPI
jgi:hypothetical protein